VSTGACNAGFSSFFLAFSLSGLGKIVLLDASVCYLEHFLCLLVRTLNGLDTLVLIWEYNGSHSFTILAWRCELTDRTGAILQQSSAPVIIFSPVTVESPLLFGLRWYFLDSSNSPGHFHKA
jgi:hypothetical protein